MALALVKLRKVNGNKVVEFLDYISYDVAKLGVQVQGELHNEDEYSWAKIVKVFEPKKEKS